MTRAAQAPILLASDAKLQRTVTRNVVVIEGSGPNALIQKISLSRSESVTLTLKLRVISAGVLPLSVAISANQPEAQVNDNRQVVILTVTPP